MIEFNATYPINLMDNIKLNLQVQSSVKSIFEMKGIITTYIENIEIVIDVIVSTPFSTKIDYIYPSKHLAKAGYYKLSFSEKIKEFNIVTKLYNLINPAYVDIIFINYWSEWLEKINRLRNILTHSIIQVHSEDNIEIVNRNQTASGDLLHTSLIINGSSISISSKNPNEVLKNWINSENINTLDKLFADLKLFHDYLTQFLTYLNQKLGNDDILLFYI
jgi:hypothetical protein